MSASEYLLAVYIDIENAFPEFTGEKLRYVFDRLAGIGSIAVCRGYADWSKIGHRSKDALEWNVTTVNLFVRGGARKNAADIAITVDAMEELYFVPTITTFVIVSGDSDLAPLATRIRERGKEVIGISRRDVASPYLVKACNRFIYFEDLLPAAQKPMALKEDPSKVQDKLIKALEEAADAEGWSYATAIKTKLMRMQKDFNEKAFGYKTFTEFLESHSDILELSRSATGVIKARLLERKVTQPVPQEVSRLEGEPTVVEEQPLTLSLDEARDLLVRAMKSSEKAGGEANLSWLKLTMIRMAPGFSEETLGYRRFLDFVQAQDDLVRLEQISPTQWKAYPTLE